MRKWIFALWAAVAMGMLPACSSTVERVTDTRTLGQFAFLQPGITTDDEVRARFGKPYAVYEEGRVATYHLEFLGGQKQMGSDTITPRLSATVHRTTGSGLAKPRFPSTPQASRDEQ